jgi:hypothetical protein
LNRARFFRIRGNFHMHPFAVLLCGFQPMRDIKMVVLENPPPQ